MKKIVALFAVALALVMLTFAVNADTFDGTLVRSNTADPNLFFYNGKYYLTQTGTSRIAVFETEHVDELDTLTLTSNIEYKGYLNGTVYDPAIEELFGAGATINGTWSPEIHYIDADMFGEEYEGWYMFLGLRKNTGDSSQVRLVVLKSTTDSPKGPYGHPTKGTVNYSQPLLNSDGSIHDEWACGQTLLTIPEGPYKGTYTMWVSEEGRGSANGGLYGEFYQKIMIAKMKSPWQIDGTPGIVTTPTQEWEYAGASTTHPRVVEGATPVYGKNGEIFITYSGSGYWSDYGIGQLTWNGGNPLETSSWVKLSVANGNPIFTATTAENLRGAGHASFLTDTDGNGFFCYHAYAYDAETDTKAGSRDAYIEPYYIDYTKWNGVSYGVISLGLNGNGVAADTASTVTFATDGSYLTAPDVYALGRTFSVTLNMVETGAEGFIIYKSTDGEVFEYLTTTVGTQYVDEDVTEGETYYYRAYAYREEEISPASEIASCRAGTIAPVIQSATADGGTVTIKIYADDNYDMIRLYRSEDGKSYGTGIQDIENVSYSATVTLTDNVYASGTYHYMATGTNGGYEYFPAFTTSVDVEVTLTPPSIGFMYDCKSVKVIIASEEFEYDSYAIYRSKNGGEYELIATVSDTSYFDTDVAVGDELSYKAKGIIEGYESNFSIARTVTVAHKEVAVEGLAPTCTADGYSASSYCEFCEATIVEKETIPASGHSYEVTEPEIPATTTSVGKTAVSTCTVCGDTIGGEEIPMLEVPEVTLAGDATGDDVINTLDALRALKAIVGMDVEINTANADANGDGSLNIADILAIIKLVLDK